MPAITGPRSAPVVTSTSSTQAKPATQAPSAPAADGYGTSSSFATAAAAPTSAPAKAIKEGREALENTPSGADKDAIALVLNKPWPSPKEMKAANDALTNLANANEMDEGDFKKLQNAVGFKNNQNTMMSMVTSNMQKQIEEIKKRGEKKD